MQRGPEFQHLSSSLELSLINFIILAHFLILKFNSYLLIWLTLVIAITILLIKLSQITMRNYNDKYFSNPDFIEILKILSLITLTVKLIFGLVSPASINTPHYKNYLRRSGSLREAITLGYSIKNKKLLNLLKKFNLIHIFVVSGMHFQILANFMKKLGASKLNTWLVISGYLIITGCGASGVRAWLATSSLLLTDSAENQLLTLSYLVILITSLNPKLLFSTGFIFSMAASLLIKVWKFVGIILTSLLSFTIFAKVITLKTLILNLIFSQTSTFIIISSIIVPTLTEKILIKLLEIFK